MAETVVTPTPIVPVVEPPKPPEFSAEQQEHINRLFNARFAKVSEKHEQELKQMSEQFEVLKKTVTPPPAPPKVGNTDEDNIRQMKEFLAQEKENNKTIQTQLTAEKAEKARVLEENKRILKDQAIHEAATSIPNGVEFHELKTVKKLVEDDIHFDAETSQWVVKENGVTKMNSSLMPMSLVDYFAAYAASHPYLVKGTVKSGTGAAESGVVGHFQGVLQIRSKADVKSTADKVAYITKFGLEKWSLLPATAK